MLQEERGAAGGEPTAGPAWLNSLVLLHLLLRNTLRWGCSSAARVKASRASL